MYLIDEVIYLLPGAGKFDTYKACLLPSFLLLSIPSQGFYNWVCVAAALKFYEFNGA